VKVTARLAGFFKGVWAELKKVHWPTPKQVAIFTGVVLVAVAIASVAIYILDVIFSWLLSLIIR